MAIPLSTTTISILRQTDLDVEPYQGDTEESRVVIASGIRATISMGNQGGSGREQVRGGEQAVLKARLSADPCDLLHTDWVKDAVTGELWHVDWATKRVALGLDHVQAALSQVKGLV